MREVRLERRKTEYLVLLFRPLRRDFYTIIEVLAGERNALKSSREFLRQKDTIPGRMLVGCKVSSMEKVRAHRRTCRRNIAMSTVGKYEIRRRKTFSYGCVWWSVYWRSMKNLIKFQILLLWMAYAKRRFRRNFICRFFEEFNKTWIKFHLSSPLCNF